MKEGKGSERKGEGERIGTKQLRRKERSGDKKGGTRRRENRQARREGRSREVEEINGCNFSSSGNSLCVYGDGLRRKDLKNFVFCSPFNAPSRNFREHK